MSLSDASAVSNVTKSNFDKNIPKCAKMWFRDTCILFGSFWSDLKIQCVKAHVTSFLVGNLSWAAHNPAWFHQYYTRTNFPVNLGSKIGGQPFRSRAQRAPWKLHEHTRKSRYHSQFLALDRKCAFGATKSMFSLPDQWILAIDRCAQHQLIMNSH